jgi:hypothetical protein
MRKGYQSDFDRYVTALVFIKVVNNLMMSRKIVESDPKWEDSIYYHCMDVYYKI